MGRVGHILIMIIVVLAVGPGCNLIWSESAGLDGLEGATRGNIQPLTNYLHRMKNANCNYQGQMLADYGDTLDLSTTYGYYYAGGCDTSASPVEMSTLELSKFDSGFVLYGATVFEQTSFRYSYPFDDIPLTEVLCRDDSGNYEVIIQEFNGQRVAKVYRKNQVLAKELVLLKTNNATTAIFESAALRVTVDKTKGIGSKFSTTIEGLLSVIEACSIQNI